MSSLSSARLADADPNGGVLPATGQAARPGTDVATAVTHATGLARQTRILHELTQARIKGNAEVGMRALAALHAHRETLGQLAGFAMLRASGLSTFEIDALILATAARLDPELRAVLASVGHIIDGAISASGILRILLPSVAERLASLPPLVRGHLVAHRLIRRPRHEGLDAEIVPSRRALSALQGHDLLFGLPAWAKVRRAPSKPGPVLAFDEAPTRQATALRAGGGAAIVVGAAGIGKTELAHAIAHALSPLILCLDLRLARISTTAADLGPAVAEILADAALLGLPVILDNAHEALAASDAASVEVAESLGRGGAVILCSSEASALGPAILARAPIRITLAIPSAHTRALIWGQMIGDGHDATLLGEEFELTPRQIRNAAESARTTGIAVRAAAAGQLGGIPNLLQPTTVQANLERIVLAADARAQLVEMIAAVRVRATVMQSWGLAGRLSRGRGLAALFCGESGTGKTMACEVVAAETGLALLRVNAATLVDKYIGETEKNLARAFAQARAAGAILLFDEADALFGSRTEVRGANDRYANLETNVLLQLMEEHHGVVLLTTNLKRNMDVAFMRRIAFKIDFDMPDDKVRADIWRVSVPPAETDEGIDYPRLGKVFPLAGGAIKSAVLRAAYRAAAAGRKISLKDLAACADLECQALGKIIAWKE